MPIQAEGHPARLVAQCNAFRLFGRHYSGIEDMDPAVGSINDPELLFVGGQANAMTRATVALDRALVEPMDFNAMKHLSGL